MLVTATDLFDSRRVRFSLQVLELLLRPQVPPLLRFRLNGDLDFKFDLDFDFGEGCDFDSVCNFGSLFNFDFIFCAID